MPVPLACRWILVHYAGIEAQATDLGWRVRMLALAGLADYGWGVRVDRACHYLH